MKTFDSVIQTTPEWYELRRSGIGSSDAPSVHNLSPYKTRLQLWKSYFEDASDIKNDAMKFGSYFEDHARARLSIFLDKEFYPKFVRHSEHEFLLASLDGLADETFCEIKYLGEKNFDACSEGKTNWLKENKIHYWIQMQHQFMVTGLKEAYFCFYSLTKDKKSLNRFNFFIVEPDDEWIIKTHIPECFSFWSEVLDKREPKKSSKDIFKELSGDYLFKINQWKQLKYKKDMLSKQLLALEDELKLKLSEHPLIEIDGVRLKRTIVNGETKDSILLIRSQK